MSPDSPSLSTAHISPSTPLLPAIKAWEYFLNDQGRSPHTVKAFTADVNLLASYLAPDRTLGSISTQDLNHFLNWLETKRGVPCSPKSLARRITSVKAFFRWLHQGAVMPIDPAEKVLQKSVLSPLPIILTRDEVKRILETAQAMRKANKPDARPFTLVSLLLNTGIKKGECLTISQNHLDLEAADGPILFVRYGNQRNRYKERKIALPPEWIPAYEEYIAQYQPAETIFPWSQRRLEYLLEDLGNAVGLDKHLSFDMCRWTCALSDWIAEMDTEKIRQKLGISKIQWREISMKLRQLAKQTHA